jgi:hypothetical protein
MNTGLIIKRKWLDQIFDNNKVWEMRTSQTKITGKIALIESGTGKIVGEAIITGCCGPIEPDLKHFDKHKVGDPELLKKWKYAWIIVCPTRYEIPIPYKHPKGAVIWVKLDDKIQRLINQLK